MLRKLPWAARWEMVFPQGASSHFGSRQSQSSPRLRAVQALGSAQPSARSPQELETLETLHSVLRAERRVAELAALELDGLQRGLGLFFFWDN